MPFEGSLCQRPPNWVGTVWKKYSYRIYKLCLQKCGTKDDADDLFQEVALRFCRKAEILKEKTYLLPWLKTVLLNCHYSIYRKKCLKWEIPFSYLNETSASYNVSEDETYMWPGQKNSMESILTEYSILLKELTPLEKMIVELSVVGGLRVEDLSLLFGLSKSGIVRRRTVAYQKMQEKIIMQKDRIKMIMGRDPSLREIIECAG